MVAVDVPTVPKKVNDWLRHRRRTPRSWRRQWRRRKRRSSGFFVGQACASQRARNLRWSDIGFGETPPRLYVHKSKTTSGIRTVPIPPELLPRLIRWRAQQVEDGIYPPTGPVLSTRTGKPMLATHVGRVIKRVAYRAGVRPIECTCGSTTITHHVPGCAQSANGEQRSEISAHTLRRT